MSGFVRRYGFFPGTELITQIEGVIIADLPPPGAINGVSTGVACVVGEFSNMSYAVAVSTTGVATPDPRPVEVFSSQDMIDKVGGWDEFLGKFGADMGNGFVAVRNKRFSRLILAPVDLITPAAGSQGTLRVWRDLPTNQSATVPQPIVPLSAASVPASREFRTSGGNRVRLASVVNFTDEAAYASGTDGTVGTVGASATQNFDSASGAFVARGVLEGDILVVGVLGGAGALGSNAGTFRVVSVTDADTIVIQKMDGTNFAVTASAVLPWRLHRSRAADSGPDHNQFGEAGGYNVLARPLDATVPTGTLLTPTVVPPAGSATIWDALSGLSAAAHPSTALTYDANVHAPNAAGNATLDARYQNAIEGLLSDSYPARDINIVTASRKSTVISAKLKSHVGSASERGLTRRAILSPAVNSNTLSTILGDTYPGVGAYRGERLDFSWPPAQTSIPEAVGFSIATADGKTTVDGVLDVPGDEWLLAVESNLPPERNPGQAQEPVPTIMAPVLSFGRGVPKLGMPEYIQLRTAGICGLRFDRTVGPIFQSGVTTSLISGEKNINRRRMADFIQDSLAQRLVQFNKLPLNQQLKDAAVGEAVAFLEELKSPNNPAASRITDYSVDDKSGNTPTTTARGIFVIIVRVRLTPTSDFIVIQTEIGENVQVQAA